MNKEEIKNLIGKSNPIIFEIGCADGVDTIDFINTFGDNMLLYCFEPDPRNIEIFENGGYRECLPHFKNGINNKNIIFEKKVIGDINGFVDFNQSNTIYSSSLKKPTEFLFKAFSITFDNILKVESITLDKYVEDNNIGLIDFIWADVQGAEDLMIIGGKNTFKNRVRYLYTEYAKYEHQKYYENSPDMERLLELLGEGWEVIKDYNTDILLKNNNIYDSHRTI